MGIFLSVLKWAAVATGLIPASGRKRYRVEVLGDEIGVFELPFTVGESVTRVPNSPPERRLLTRPFRVHFFDNPLYYWVEPDADDATEVVTWEPSTADEIAEANRFFCAAHGLNLDGTPRPEKARPLARRSDEETRLIDAVRAAPDADGPMLAYADWLNAKGDPRGEFIRLTVEMNRLPEGDPGRERPDARRQKLLKKHGPRWMKGLTDLGFFPGIMFAVQVKMFFPDLWLDKRGVVLELDVENPAVLPARADRLFSAAPFVRKLSVNYNGTTPLLADFANIPGFAQLETLSIHSAEATEEAVLAFANSPHLGRLRSLDLMYTRLGPEAGLYLGQSPSLGNLRHLLLGSCALGDAGVDGLVASAVCANLTELNLSGNELTDDALRALAASPHLTNLTDLVLERNHFTDDGIAALAGAAFFGTLTRLDLNGCELPPAAATALAALPFAKLKSLNLGSNALGGHGWQTVVGARFFPDLQTLGASYAGVGDTGAEVLARVGFTSLQEVELPSNEIGDRGIVALAGSQALARVKKLALHTNPFGVAGAKALAASKTLTEVTELDLRYIDLGEPGARALAAAKNFPKLERLMVSTEQTGGAAGEKILRDRFGENVMSFF